jgi:hypothetical protein
MLDVVWVLRNTIKDVRILFIYCELERMSKMIVGLLRNMLMHVKKHAWTLKINEGILIQMPNVLRKSKFEPSFEPLKKLLVKKFIDNKVDIIKDSKKHYIMDFLNKR